MPKTIGTIHNAEQIATIILRIRRPIPAISVQIPDAVLAAQYIEKINVAAGIAQRIKRPQKMTFPLNPIFEISRESANISK
jgi:hypothetical protein